MLALLITGAGWIWQAVGQRRYQSRVAELAAQWRMHYSHEDRFRLSDRIAERLEIPGAAQVRVTDLIYGNEEGFYRYLVLVAYTTGVARLKARHRRVVTFCESKDRTGPAGWTRFALAPEDLPIVEQYQNLRESQMKCNEPR